MKTTRKLTQLLAVLAIVLVIVCIWGLHRQSKSVSRSEIGGMTNLPSEAEPNPSAPLGAPATSLRAVGARDQQGDLQLTTSQVKPKPPISRAVQEKNVLINFWGQTVDQDAKPIPGVRVVMSVRQWTYSPSAGVGSVHPRTEALTDDQGRFELLNVEGNALDLEQVEKEGYRLSPRAQTGFAYGDSPQPFHPDPNAPFKIQMWKMGKPEHLVSNRTLFGLVPDGRAYTLNLLTNKKQEGELQDGDIIVRLKRPMNIEPREQYPWVLQIQAVQGGLAEATNEFTYLAPDAGYQPQFMIQMNPGEAHWAGSATKDFYVRSRNGQIFGVVRLRIRAQYNSESAIFVESRMNPNGSRNLEPK